jgi:hypothetical protein
LTTAEKRALLEEQGEPWPTCECHDEPKGWASDSRYTAGGFFRCNATLRESNRRLIQSRRDEGVCIRCGQPPVTETLCAVHARSHADATWRYEQKPHRQLAKTLHNMRYRNAQRVEEGFQPTGAGKAAFAAYVSNRGDT